MNTDPCPFCTGAPECRTDLGTRCTYCEAGRTAWHHDRDRYGRTDPMGDE
jgi:hypothetical protein